MKLIVNFKNQNSETSQVVSTADKHRSVVISGRMCEGWRCLLARSKKRKSPNRYAKENSSGAPAFQHQHGGPS